MQKRARQSTVKKQFSFNEKNLIRRYLIWCYKTTKESLDRIDRYYTQLEADQFILKELKTSKSFQAGIDVKKMVDDFEGYMHKKKINVDAKKFFDLTAGRISPEYEYLNLRFIAIEKAILSFLGKKELTRIHQLYEMEMTQRILSAREHT